MTSSTESSTNPVKPISPRALHSLLTLAAENRPEKIPAAISRAISNTMRAEVCFLVSTPDQDGNITIFEGFNLIDEAILPGSFISTREKPVIAEKLLDAQPYWNNDKEDVSGFFLDNQAKVKATVLMCPVITMQREPIGGVMLLSPFSHRIWNSQDLIQLTAMVDTVAHILQRVDYIATLEEKLARATADRVYRSVEEKAVTPMEVVPEMPPPVEIEPKTKMGRIFKHAKNQPFYELEASMLLDEVTYLNTDLENLKGNPRSSENEFGTGGPYMPPSEPAEIDMVRSAVSAITGYADLLMGETAGPLTPLQKKFLTRIQVSTGKINHAMTTLEYTEIDIPGKYALEEFSFRQVIRKTLIDFTALIDQKKMKIELALHPDLPPLLSNRENLEIILHKIVKKMLIDSMDNSKITILVKKVNQDEKQNGILCSITSSESDTRTKTALVNGEIDQQLENEVAGLLPGVHGQVWINQVMHQEKTIHFFIENQSGMQWINEYERTNHDH